MHLKLIAIGHLKKSGEAELSARYISRIEKSCKALGFKSFTVIELSESKAFDVSLRMKDETERLLAKAEGVVFCLDERGEMMRSEKLASLLNDLKDNSTACLTFIIGGTDGLDKALIASHKKISLSSLTLPHQLARVVLLEQIYRCLMVISGHPYHKD